jgi:hypothetical protein
MTHGKPTLEPFHIMAFEDIRHQSPTSLTVEDSILYRDDASRLLAPMLKGIKTQIDQIRSFDMVANAEDTALIVKMVVCDGNQG